MSLPSAIAAGYPAIDGGALPADPRPLSAMASILAAPRRVGPSGAACPARMRPTMPIVSDCRPSPTRFPSLRG